MQSSYLKNIIWRYRFQRQISQFEFVNVKAVDSTEPKLQGMELERYVIVTRLETKSEKTHFNVYTK